MLEKKRLKGFVKNILRIMIPEFDHRISLLWARNRQAGKHQSPLVGRQVSYFDQLKLSLFARSLLSRFPAIETNAQHTQPCKRFSAFLKWHALYK